MSGILRLLTMTRFLLRTVLLGFCLAIPRVMLAQSSCLSPDTTVIPVIKSRLISLVTASDSESVRIRNSYNLPSLNANAVTLVIDATTCTKAANALAAVTPNGNPADGAYVFKMGNTRYVAFNGKQRAHQTTYAVVFDKNFVRLESFSF
jgi:hypothetical protein